MFKKFLDLGNQPLANSYLQKNNSSKKEIVIGVRIFLLKKVSCSRKILL